VSAGASRIVQGMKIPHPCGKPGTTSERDRDVRLALVNAALDALARDIDEPIVLNPCSDW
jgi:hypothetical protein